MAAPVNVVIADPSIPVDGWPAQAARWRELNANPEGELHGAAGFYPLTVKAAYVIGVIHGICESVAYLLQVSTSARELTYLPAYGIFASSIELLGRCINGNGTSQGSIRDLRRGFQWVADPGLPWSTMATDAIVEAHVLVRADADDFSVHDLMQLRHFVAHGQATARWSSLSVAQNRQVLAAMPPLIAAGLDRYWNSLQHDEHLCNMLALAAIEPLGSQPIMRSWVLFSADEHEIYHSITAIFNRFNWH
jgi:hypothetical protein